MSVKKKLSKKQIAKSQRAEHKPLDINQIRRWQRAYSEGKLSKRQIMNITQKLTKERDVANRRLKRFRATGQTSPAASRALGKIAQSYGEGRKSWGKAKDFETLLMQAGNVNAFTRDLTSTVTGAKAYDRKKLDEFRAKHGEVAHGMSDADLREFLRFLHDDNLNEYFDFFSNYVEEMEKMAYIMEEDSGQDWLNGMLQQHKEFLEETQERGTPFHDIGISTRELHEAIEKKYSDIRRRRRK